MQRVKVLYPDSQDGFDAFSNRTNEYISRMNMDNTIIPTITNWARYLGIARQTLDNYSRRGDKWQIEIQRNKYIIKQLGKARVKYIKLSSESAIDQIIINELSDNSR